MAENQIQRAQRIAREVLAEYPTDADITEVFEEYKRRIAYQPITERQEQ